MQSKINNLFRELQGIMRKMAKKSFKEYYEGLEPKERIRVRDAFLEASDLKYPTWYTKLKDGNFSKLELAALSQICDVMF